MQLENEWYLVAPNAPAAEAKCIKYPWRGSEAACNRAP